jgi:hypothetical protein
MHMTKFFKFMCFFSFLLIASNKIYSQQPCNKLPQRFTSYKEAITKVERATFIYNDHLSGNFSSWINTAIYNSCDKQKGFLIIKTKGRKYIHLQVPLSIWLNFKKASSKGSFYNSKIKNRYNNLNLN